MTIRVSSVVAAILGAIGAASVGASPVAIVHAHAWTMVGTEPTPDATILIDGSHIVSITPGGAAPADARVIDAGGRTVTPGIVNAATQIGLAEVSTVPGTQDQSSTAPGIGAGFDVSRALNPNSTLLALARADGMTGGLSFPGQSGQAPFSGQAALIKLRDGPDILDTPRAALVVVIGGARWKDAGSRAAQWQLLRNALDKARAAKAPPLVGSDDAAISAVVNGRMPIAIFTDRESDIRETAKLADDYHIRIAIIGGAEAWRAADALATAHVAVVLDPEADMPTSFDELGNRLDAAALLNRAGVKVAFGIAGGAIELSYNAGLEVREGAGLAVANGLPYVEGLKAITVNPRVLWGGGDGTLAPGEPADLVIWDGDPLEPGTNALTVLIDGQTVSTANRQRALEERYLPAAKPD